jgi:hypothetical protein
MSFNALSVEFEIDAQKWREGQFSIPKAICDLLEIGHESDALVEITTRMGTKCYRVTIKSGYEVYKLPDILKGELIRVRVSRLPEP